MHQIQQGRNTYFLDAHTLSKSDACGDKKEEDGCGEQEVLLVIRSKCFIYVSSEYYLLEMSKL